MPFPNPNAKRSQPVDVDAPSKAKSTRKGASKNTNTHLSTSPKSSKLSGTSPNTLSPGSAHSSGSSHGGTTPPTGHGYHDLHKSSKKLSKAIRGASGGGGGHGGKQFKVKQRKIGDGPEAELSEEDDGSDPEVEEDADTDKPVQYDVNGSIERSAGTSVKEIDMVSLLAGAKLRPEPANISRGYEMITSPASKMIIPFDHNAVSTSTTGHEDDEGWENVQFDMDMDDVYESVLSESTTMSVHVHADKTMHAYGDVVKRL